MLLRLLLPFFLLFPLFANEDSWYLKIDTEIEAGMYLPIPNGTISNSQASSSFYTDYGYKDLRASWFAISYLLHDDYIPNIHISYFRMSDNTNKDLNRTVVVADGEFSSSVATIISYNVLNIIIYQDFKKKGKYLPIFGKQYYSGDIEFDVGLNTKMINWRFDIENKSNLTQTPSWIKVDEFIPLPFIGMRYYLYDFNMYANISALAFSKAKSTSYQLGAYYRVVNSLYLNVGYLYEEFKAVEKLDTINFETRGYKLGFKYIF